MMGKQSHRKRASSLALTNILTTCQYWPFSHQGTVPMMMMMGHAATRRKRKGTGRSHLRDTACDVWGPDFGFLTSRSLPLQDDCFSFATIVARHAVLSLLGVSGLSFAHNIQNKKAICRGDVARCYSADELIRQGATDADTIELFASPMYCSSFLKNHWAGISDAETGNKVFVGSWRWGGVLPRYRVTKDTKVFRKLFHVIPCWVRGDGCNDPTKATLKDFFQHRLAHI